MKTLFDNKALTSRAICLFAILFLWEVASGQSQVVKPDGAPKVDAKTKTAIIDSVAIALHEIYVFPAVAKNMEKLMRSNLHQGKYDRISNLPEFTEEITKDLQSVSHDKHLGVRPLPPREPGEKGKPSPEEERKQREQELQQQNFGFKKVELLPGNIGYIDFRFFADAGFGGAGVTAIAAMNFLAYADAIIFDLRQNGGGNPSMIQLINSYLFEEPVHLNSFYIRKSNATQQFWTQAHVQGRKMVKTPVYVLTSNFTFSGAEEFTYNLKNLKRGTIIGETTGGGAHPVERRVFENLNIAMSVPFGRAVNPITGTNWEGTGVEPDLKVPADHALLVARIEATKHLMEKATDETKKRQYAWALQGLEVERNPVTLNAAALNAFVGVYGPRKISLENGILYYQREGRPKYKLMPMGEDAFMLDGLDYFRLKFNRDDAGLVMELVGMYDNGETDSHKRTNP